MLLSGVALGCLAAAPFVMARTAQAGATPTPSSLASAGARAGVRAHQVPCLDLPISSALIVPGSCWQTGLNSILVVGARPGAPGTGEVAVIAGQARSLARLPGSGPLRLTGVGTASACLEEGRGGLHRIQLQDGAVSPKATASCTPANGSASSAAATPATPVASLLASRALPPAVVPSYYEDYSYYTSNYCGSTPSPKCALYQQGASTYTPSGGALSVLDFGAPCYVPGTTTYGVELFGDYSVCVTDSEVRTLVGAWIRGYESDHGAGTPTVTLAVGTSNSENSIDPGGALTNAQMTASGRSWYSQVVGSISTSGLAAPVRVWGASDMEQAGGGWYSGNPTANWVKGYSAYSPARKSTTCSLSSSGLLADYGDDVLGGAGSANGWTVSQVYQVVWGEPPACALPEIYVSAMATEWKDLSQWGAQNTTTGSMVFTGVMTTTSPYYNTPTEGWDELENDTGQSPPIPCLTNIGTGLQGQPPQVTRVSPASGTTAGGTAVTVYGKGLLGAQAVYFGSTAASSFSVVNSDTITATSPAGAAGFADVRVETDLGTSTAGGTDGFLYSPGGPYQPLAPVRIEDTRSGSGLPGAGHPPGPGKTIDIQVSGKGGVPSSGVGGVMINLTITQPTKSGFVSAFPAGIAPPPTSSVNFTAGATKANLIEVGLGRSGQISVYNSSGTTQVVVDVEGWYRNSASSSGAGLFNPAAPERIADTRPGSGQPYAGMTLGPGQSLQVQVAGEGGIPTTGAAAVVMNLTAVGPSTSGFLTVYPAGASRPLSSNLNFAAGEIVVNQVVVKLGTGGKVTVYNPTGTVNFVLDVAGWFGDGSSGASSGADAYAMAPSRALDTRVGSGQPYSGDTLEPGQTLTVQLAGLAGLPALGMAAVTINVTVTDTRASGYLDVWASTQSQPATSEVNWVPGETAQNLVVTAVGSTGGVSFCNRSSGTIQLVVDANGWFATP